MLMVRACAGRCDGAVAEEAATEAGERLAAVTPVEAGGWERRGTERAGGGGGREGAAAVGRGDGGDGTTCVWLARFGVSAGIGTADRLAATVV